MYAGLVSIYFDVEYLCVHCQTACASQAEQEAAECTAVSVFMREKKFLVWTKNCLYRNIECLCIELYPCIKLSITVVSMCIVCVMQIKRNLLLLEFHAISFYDSIIYIFL